MKYLTLHSLLTLFDDRLEAGSHMHEGARA